MKKKYLHLIFFLFFCAVIAALLYFSLFDFHLPKESGQYSVVLYQYADNDWGSLLEGIRQAEKDSGAVVSYVSMTPDGTAAQQLELIRREVENGAEGIVTAPIDSEALTDELQALAKELPVITLETGFGSAPADISGDNYGMGYLLGEKAAEAMNAEGSSSVCVISEYTQRESVRRRYEGFTDAVRSAVPNVQITDYQRSEGDFSLPVCIANIYRHMDESVFLAALDKFCTQSLAEASDSTELDAGQRASLRSHSFGIGNTEKTVNALDSGRLSGLVYQNEFNMGYQGLQALIRKAQKKQPQPEAEIKYYYVTRDTLYTPEHQQLLFPLQ